MLIGILFFNPFRFLTLTGQKQMVFSKKKIVQIGHIPLNSSFNILFNTKVKNFNLKEKYAYF